MVAEEGRERYFLQYYSHWQVSHISVNHNLTSVLLEVDLTKFIASPKEEEEKEEVA